MYGCFESGPIGLSALALFLCCCACGDSEYTRLCRSSSFLFGKFGQVLD